MASVPSPNGVVQLNRRGIATEAVIHDPATRNAMSERLVADLEAVLATTADDPSCRVLVIKGADGSFCAGADLKGVGAVAAEDPAFPGKSAGWLLNRRGGRMYDALNRHPKTVIAIVDGPAIGGGFGLACCADIVICTERAKFALSETTLGLAPAQIAPFVIARIGLPATRRLALTGARFGAAEALSIGLADYAVADAPEAEGRLDALLGQIARCAPEANAATKRLLFEAASGRADYPSYAADVFARCLASDEAREGIAAFAGKRLAQWVEEG